jgi:hypothetical protein
MYDCFVMQLSIARMTGLASYSLPLSLILPDFLQPLKMSDKPEEVPAAEEVKIDCSNPDVVTKYRAAGDIANAALKVVLAMCKAGTKIVDVCAAGDGSIMDATGKIYKGKKIEKGQLLTPAGRPWLQLCLTFPFRALPPPPPPPPPKYNANTNTPSLRRHRLPDLRLRQQCRGPLLPLP